MRPFMLRRTKQDLATKLPDKIEMNVSVGLSALQLKMYQEILQTKTVFGQNSSSVGMKQYHNVLM